MSSLDWNPDAASWVKGGPYVTERTLSRHTSRDEHPVPVNLSALSNDPLDDIWDGRACFALVQLSGALSDKVNAPEPIPITCISDLSSSVGRSELKREAHRMVRQDVAINSSPSGLLLRGLDF